MKNIVQWIKDRLGLIKSVFVVSVVVIVVAELFSISKSINFQQLSTIFADLPLWKILLMLMIGLVAVVPMVGYDVILNRILKQKPKPQYLFETSWLINTINNVAGFGGLISIGLRSEFYGKEAEGKDVAKALSKIFLFLMSGLSIFSLIGFLLLRLDHVPSYVDQYWIWLLGGSLYFPVVFIISVVKKEGYMGGLAASDRLGLVLTSFLEWAGVLGSFLAIGQLMGISVRPTVVIPLFIAASVIGIVSMIPGELGSFDLMMIIGLSAVGVNREQVVAWILLYRLFYYIIPFFIGCVFFAKNLSGSLNDRYNGLPKDLATEMAHKIVVFLLYFSGVMMVLSATIPQAFQEFKWLARLNPLSFHLVSQFPSILLGFLLIIMGRGIAARVKRAYLPTIITLAVALGYTIFLDFSWGVIGYLGILLVIVIFSKPELFREQLVYSWEMRTFDGVIFAALTLLYLGIGVYNLPRFPHHNHRFVSFLFFPSEKVWLSGFLAIILMTLFIYLFLRYLGGVKHQLGEPVNDARVLKLLDTYGGNGDSQLIFLKDKVMSLYKNDEGEETVLFQFKTYNDKVVLMGDPSGKKSDFPAALAQLVNEADRWGYHLVLYEVTEEFVLMMHDFGYDFMKMGEEAHVDLPTFTTSGKKMKSQRAVLNRIERENYQFEVVNPPFSDDFMNELQAVSDEWLAGRREKGFSLGYFSRDYLSHAPIAVVKDEQGAIVSFANFMPTYSKEEGTIDLMRHSKSAPSGVMDFLFIHLFDYMRDEGVQFFNLGMAPLANVGTSRKSFFQERVASLIYQFGSRFYSFQGLKDYKEKYATSWISKYTLYSRDSSLIYVMLVLLIIDNAPVDQRKPMHGVKRIIKHIIER